MAPAGPAGCSFTHDICCKFPCPCRVMGTAHSRLATCSCVRHLQVADPKCSFEAQHSTGRGIRHLEVQLGVLGIDG